MPVNILVGFDTIFLGTHLDDGCVQFTHVCRTFTNNLDCVNNVGLLMAFGNAA